MLESTDKEANAGTWLQLVNLNAGFTDEESNAAIASYGCDCSSCLNALYVSCKVSCRFVSLIVLRQAQRLLFSNKPLCFN